MQIPSIPLSGGLWFTGKHDLNKSCPTPQSAKQEKPPGMSLQDNQAKEESASSLYCKIGTKHPLTFFGCLRLKHTVHAIRRLHKEGRYELITLLNHDTFLDQKYDIFRKVRVVAAELTCSLNRSLTSYSWFYFDLIWSHTYFVNPIGYWYIACFLETQWKMWARWSFWEVS